jgi:hypothetical protein
VKRPRLNHATIVAYLALFAALGGGAYAALRLPKNSVGARQLRKNAVRSSKVKNRSLLANDFKPGQLPAGPHGPKGDRGIQGLRGFRGPGTLSFDGQFPISQEYTTIAVLEGMRVKLACGGPAASLRVERLDASSSFYGFGTEFGDSGPSRVTVLSDGSGVEVLAGNTIQLDLVAHATAPGKAVKWTHFDILAIKGGACNYHALIIPPS